MGFLERFIAETLSIMSVTTSPYSLPSSFNKFINHTVWSTYNEAAMYSTSTEESATNNAFFEHPEIGISSNIKIY